MEIVKGGIVVRLDRDLLHRIMMIAQEMTEAGAEISRVEEMVDRVSCAYGAERADVFATTSNIIVSVEDENGAVITQTRRVKNRVGNNMERLHQYNMLVRWMASEAPSIDEVDARIEEVRRSKKYSVWLTMLFSAVVSSAFCLFFGGRSWQEFVTAFAVGAVSCIVLNVLERWRINPIVIRFLSAFSASIITFFAVHFRFIALPDYVLIGNIMTLIPGVGLTNAMRDLFSGDVISGILRAIEALLFTLGIALGMILPTVLLGGVL